MNAVITLVIGFAVSVLIVGRLIPFLKKKQFKQYVREEGPQSHLKKTGTPSMGGIGIIGGAIISSLIMGLVTKSISMNTLMPMIAMLLYALIGFIDDYEKAIKKNNLGLNAKQNLVMQFAVGFITFGAGCGNYMAFRYMELYWKEKERRRRYVRIY